MYAAPPLTAMGSCALPRRAIQIRANETQTKWRRANVGGRRSIAARTIRPWLRRQIRRSLAWRARDFAAAGVARLDALPRRLAGHLPGRFLSHLRRRGRSY